MDKVLQSAILMISKIKEALENLQGGFLRHLNNFKGGPNSFRGEVQHHPGA